MQLKTDQLDILVSPDGADLALTFSGWPGLKLGPLAPSITVDGAQLTPVAARAELRETDAGPSLQLTYDFAEGRVQLVETWTVGQAGAVYLRAALRNHADAPMLLNRVVLLETSLLPDQATWGAAWPSSLVYWDRGYSGAVEAVASLTRPVFSAPEWLIYSPAERAALLVGYLTFERWAGVTCLDPGAEGMPGRWGTGMDGGDTLIEPGETLLAELVLMTGSDPNNLLATYGDLVQERYGIQPPARPPVTWCSWYPYRLGVTEERCLANAALGAKRLGPLGLQTMLLDLGWEAGYLPSSFEENDQFSHGLKWLSEQLAGYGLGLGTWVAPFSISEHHPLVKEHPEWLIQDEHGEPLSTGTWFWYPHGNTYCLDLTHPGAQEWLRVNMTSLAERGVSYYKTDFIGIVTSANMRHRHDPWIVAGGGLEAARLGARIIREAIDSQGRRSQWLNCGTEAAAMGLYDLLYTCNDTGNTGYVGWDTVRDDYTSVACHLFKNNRWATIQPSCLCVGLPGTLDEARLRATATFLCGGQVDIGDELVSLPEERWQVLLATLPPLGQSAEVIDLFEPLTRETLSYEGLSTGDQVDPLASVGSPSACAWHLPLRNDWDAWHLLALFDYTMPEKHEISRFQVDLARIGLDSAKSYWVYEFWSGSCLGQIPREDGSPHGYRHPGDSQRLIASKDGKHLEVAFFGPGVKLLAFREARPHPWVVGTTFHQSCGMELRNVRWDEQQAELSGELVRPAGQQGSITIGGMGAASVEAMIDGCAVQPIPAAFDSLVIPISTTADLTRWSIRRL